MRYQQFTASVLALAIGGTALMQSYQGAVAAEAATTITSEQRQVARQVAALLDRSHYLDKRMDAKTGKEVLADYIDALDPNHSLFLQSDVDEFNKNMATILLTISNVAT